MVYTSHSTAECGSLSGHERRELYTRLSSIYLAEKKGPVQGAEGQLRPDPVPAPTSPCEQRAQPRPEASGLSQHVGPPQAMVSQEEHTALNTLQPVPSQVLHVDYRGRGFTITLDTGATVSFCSPALVKRLALTLHPNSQLALLADSRYRVRSMGEVDFLVVERSTGEALLRVRALVMDNLTVDCYGGQTFHLDNAVSGDVSSGRVNLHGGRWEVKAETSAISQPKPPPAQSLKEMPGQQGTNVSTTAAISSSGGTVMMKLPKTLLPDGAYNIPTTQDPSVGRVLVLPPVRDTSQAGPLWRPQICRMAGGAAVYVNKSPTPLHHPKFTHFKTIPIRVVPTRSDNPVNYVAHSILGILA